MFYPATPTIWEEADIGESKVSHCRILMKRKSVITVLFTALILSLVSISGYAVEETTDNTNPVSENEEPSTDTLEDTSEASDETYNTVKAPLIKSAVPVSKSSIRISWLPSRNAYLYCVFCKAPGGAWKSVGCTTKTDYTARWLTSNTKYSFQVRAIVNEGRRYTRILESNIATATTWIEAPVIQSATVESGSTVALSWKKTVRTSQYRVYYRSSDATSWTKLGDTKTNTYKIKGLSKNASYSFAVRSMDAKGTMISGYSKKQSLSVNAKNGRFIVTCNANYTNKVNTLGRYLSKDAAIAAIKKQPSDTRGQWLVCDGMENMAVVYPANKTRSQKLQLAVSWAIAIAADSRHGYSCVGECSDNNTRTALGRWGKDGDYSCSTLVASAYEMAGIVNLREITAKHHLKCKADGDTYQNSLNSSNFEAACVKSGKFKDITSQYRASGKSALQPGDILISRSKGHVVLYIGNGRMVEAAMNELGREYATPRAGDQTGSEIRTRRLSGSWGTILRYKG